MELEIALLVWYRSTGEAVQESAQTSGKYAVAELMVAPRIAEEIGSW